MPCKGNRNLLAINISSIYNPPMKCKNFHKAFVASFVILSFTLSIIFCCCIKESLAQDIPSSGHCHKTNANHKPKSHHGCVCQIPGDHFRNIFAFQLTSPDFYKSFLKDQLTLVQFFFASLSYTSSFIERSPPSLAQATTPIYLKNFVLRI